MLSFRKVCFIVREKERGLLSDRRIRKLAKASKSTFYRVVKRFGRLTHEQAKKEYASRPPPGRRPARTPVGFIETVIKARLSSKASDRVISRQLAEQGIHIPHVKVYSILRSAGLIRMLKEKRKRRTWVRWERKHSLSLWQTDWSVFRGRWLIVILDDASRLIVGWGLFDNATSEHSVEVLKKAIEEHGKPRAILTGRDAQFYSTMREGLPDQAKTYFQRFLAANVIEHKLARVNHPQTCGKVERVFGEIKKRILSWHDFDTVEETVNWHNSIKPHMSLSDEKRLVTPLQAFSEKMHHKAKIVRTWNEAVS